MTDKLELKSCYGVIGTVDVANIESIFHDKSIGPDILTVVMKGGKRLYCDEVCPIDSLQEENSFDSHIQEGDKITVNEDGSRFNRSQLERVIAAQKYANQMEEKVGCGIEFTTNEIEDAFLAGMIEGQKRMIKQVIEREVKVDAGGYHCKFCAERRKHELKELVEQLKDK